MIRLAVHGKTDRWGAVAARLRGCAITCFPEIKSPPAATSHDAMLFEAPEVSETGLIEQSLAQGKHVLIASPANLTHDVLGNLSSSAKRYGVQLAAINPERYFPSRRLLQQQLEAGKLGRPGLIRMYRWEPAPTSSKLTPPSLPVALTLDLDVTLWLIGMMPNVVFATMAVPPNGPASQAQTIQVHLGFPNNAMALISYSSALPPGDDYRSLSVMGSDGAAYLDDHQNMQMIFRGSHPQALRTEEGVGSLVNLTQSFVDALQADIELAPGLAEWQRTRLAARAVEQSLESRQAISMEGC
jgi:predicted dehydrogenase